MFNNKQLSIYCWRFINKPEKHYECSDQDIHICVCPPPSFLSVLTKNMDFRFSSKLELSLVPLPKGMPSAIEGEEWINEVEDFSYQKMVINLIGLDKYNYYVDKYISNRNNAFLIRNDSKKVIEIYLNSEIARAFMNNIIIANYENPTMMETNLEINDCTDYRSEGNKIINMYFWLAQDNRPLY